jgi:small conductance mechanosensitive channel
MWDAIWFLVKVATLAGAGWLAHAWCSSALASQLDRSKIDPEVRWKLLKWSSPAVALVVGASLAGTLGVDVSPVSATMAVGLGVVGLAALPVFRAVTAGFVLRTVRPFRPGDHVEIAGVRGIAGDLGLFGCVVQTNEGATVFVTHSDALARPVQQLPRAGGRVTVSLRVPAGSMARIVERVSALDGHFEAIDGTLFATLTAEAGDNAAADTHSRLAVSLEGALRE